MIEPVTSIADLLFKAKTQEPYKQLVILTVNEVFTKTDPTPIDTYEKAVVALDKYTKYTQGVTDCSVIVSSINWMRNRIPDPADVEFNKLFVLKERQPRRADTAADNARPQFNGEYLTVSGGGGYSRVAEEYERMRREVVNNNSTYSTYSTISSQPQPTIYGNNSEIIEHRYINPITGLRHTVSRRVPSNIPMGIRLEIQEQLRLDAEADVRRWNEEADRRGHTQADDFYSEGDDYISMQRRINEDNPNVDR